MKRVWVLVCVLLAGCPSMPFRNYEVPTLPEELVLKSVAQIAGGLERGDYELIAAAYAEDFRVDAYDAGRWTTVSAAYGLEVRRWARASVAAPLSRDGVLDQWRRYVGGFRTVARAEVKPRLIRVADSAAKCTVYLSVMGVDADGRSRNDRFWLDLQLRQGESGWLLTRQEIIEGDAALGTRSRFRDIARENGTAYPGRLPDREDPDPAYAVVSGDCGLAAADYDGDGWVDLYVCDGVRNALLRNRGDGAFEDVTARAGLETQQGLSRSAIFFDADNDGDLDLFVTFERAPCRFYENRGDGTFRHLPAAGLEYVGFPTSIAVADFDADGLLDVYLGVYGDSHHELPLLESRNGHPNVLYRNLGGLRFKDVTSETRVGDRGWTLAVAWGDYDNDGDPDIFVVNDVGNNTLYRNDGGRFTDVTEDSGARAAGFGMSGAFGDYDNDGKLDFYMAGMYSNAGQWIFQRRELLPVPGIFRGLRERVLGTLDEMTDGNRLLHNAGGGRFVEIGHTAGVDYGQFSWGSAWVDIDNDGFLDIYCANGFWSGPDIEDT